MAIEKTDSTPEQPELKLPTAAQLKVLRLLDTQRPPTIREMMAECGYASPKAVADHIHWLEKKGYVCQPWGENTSRGWTLTEAGKQMAARR